MPEDNMIQYERTAYQLEDDSTIDWSVLIFLPFHPIFRFLVLLSVIIKCTLGPIQSVYTIVNCSDVMDQDVFLLSIKYMYWYCCDFIYGIDTFLHIVHRQVTDKAMRREFFPKSVAYILLDILSLIPFYRLMAASNCPNTQMWPNLVAFTEFLIIYRVVDYFALVTTHSYWKLTIGFTIMLGICVNAVTCFWLLLTHAMCKNCDTNLYDWRTYAIEEVNHTHPDFATYIFGSSFILFITLNTPIDETKPSAIWEFYMTCLFLVCAYAFNAFIVAPKITAEALLRLQGVCSRYAEVKKIIEETKRRNPDPKAHENVESFYVSMWKNCSGITAIPNIIADVPRYLRIEIKQDLVWQVFYHSPTLRKTSNSFKRYLCDFIKFDYKLPGQRFFSGPHGHNHLYYIKSGIIQFISRDEGSTPILSITSGSVLGDVSFLVPPIRRNAIVKCRSYCEVFFCEREHLLRAMHKYPADSAYIRKQVQNRLEHAHTLFACKKKIMSADRTEDEGVSWLIKRWWEISTAMQSLKKKSRNVGECAKFELPPEEIPYHCAKYIGQLVLCSEEQLQLKSMFANVSFPWIFTSESFFGIVWHRIVVSTVFFVLLFYPPNLSITDPPSLFRLFQYWTDFIYGADICVSLMTCLSGQEQGLVNFTIVMFSRCKKISFILDVLSSIWTENIVKLIGRPDLCNIAQFNRLIKIHTLFLGDYAHLNIRQNPIGNVVYKIALTHFVFMYISSYFLFNLTKYIPNLSRKYFYGERLCDVETNNTCDPAYPRIKSLFMSWTFEELFSEYLPHHINDLYITFTVSYYSFFVLHYCKMRFIACLYVKLTQITKYQYVVSNLKTFYKRYQIHPDLLKRLERYFDCHWKYYNGIDVLKPDMLKNEPYDVYWKVQGAVAEKVIGESKIFFGADHTLVKELAYAAKMMILPNQSTLVLFGAHNKTVTWVVQGHIKCEYHDEEGQLLRTFPVSGQLLSISSVFLGGSALRTYTTCTDCEIVYIQTDKFFNIIKRYPAEWAYLNNSIEEFRRECDEMIKSYVEKHRDYQNKLRETIFTNRRSTMVPLGAQKAPKDTGRHQSPMAGEYWGCPTSQFMQNWFIIRVITVFISIFAAAAQGGVGANHRWKLTMIGAFCDCIALTDIILKLFLSYYDKRGLLISDKRMCLTHYLARGFLLDVIGVTPVDWIQDFILAKQWCDDDVLLWNTFSKFAHLYIIHEYFDYICDIPSMRVTFIKILKWQLINLLVVMGLSHYLMIQCVDFTYNDRLDLVNMQYINTCWIPRFIKMNDELNLDNMHLIYSNSLNIAQSGLTRMNFGRFRFKRRDFGVGLALLVAGIIWWFIACYSLTILVLSIRGDTQFQQGVNQLVAFLKAERVENSLITRIVDYYRYIWLRTKGINIHQITYERIGLIFRQDLSYYFYKKTFIILDSVLKAGETLERELASACRQAFFLPRQDIIREMNVSTSIHIVHRGKVIISQDGEKITTLTKGCIFGLLDGSKLRPSRITAVAEGHADLLQIPVKTFQDIVGDEVRENIANNPQSKLDYLAPKKIVMETPKDTIAYLLRGRKTMQLPWMSVPVKAKNNWYQKWLFLAWFCEPVCCAAIVTILGTFPMDLIIKMYWVLMFLDVIHLANFLSEFYTLNLDVTETRCVMQKSGWRIFKQWRMHIDMMSLIIPLLTIFTGNWQYQLARMLRLKSLYDFDVHFCRNFMSRTTPVLMKFTVLVLFIHTFTCGWIYTACRHDEFPLKIPLIDEEANKTIDYERWVLPDARKGGCPHLTKNTNNSLEANFVKPKHWEHDYVIALIYMLLIQTHSSMDSVVSLTTKESYYKVVVTFVMLLTDIIILATAINWVYSKYRALYQYDYNVNNLTIYLNRGGLTPSLTTSVVKYTKQLWRRQRGNWLPELVTLAPTCLREDLYCSLYGYHLDAPPIYRKLPHYFKRQMAARLKRIVIFPGKCIIREGDIFPCTYFVHEGEVEKWYTDANGESTFMSLLYTNGYFGTLPGLLHNVSFQFSYYTRTLVDLIFLRFHDWKDLLDCYPEVTRELYSSARHVRHTLAQSEYGKRSTFQGI